MVEFIDRARAVAEQRLTEFQALREQQRREFQAGATDEKIEAERQRLRQELADKGIPTRQDANIGEMAAILATKKVTKKAGEVGERVAGVGGRYFGEFIGGAPEFVATTAFAAKEAVVLGVTQPKSREAFTTPAGRQEIGRAAKEEAVGIVTSFREAPTAGKIGIIAGALVMGKGPSIARGGARAVGRGVSAGADIARATKVTPEGIFTSGEKVTPRLIVERTKARIGEAAPEVRAPPTPEPKTVREALLFSERAKGATTVETLDLGMVAPREPAGGSRASQLRQPKTEIAASREAFIDLSMGLETPGARGRAGSPSILEFERRRYEPTARRYTEEVPNEIRTLEPFSGRTGSIFRPSEVRDVVGYRETIRTRDPKWKGTFKLIEGEARPRGRFMDVLLSERAQVAAEPSVSPRFAKIKAKYKPQEYVIEDVGADVPRGAKPLEQPFRLSPEVLTEARGKPLLIRESARSYRGLLDLGTSKVKRPTLFELGRGTTGFTRVGKSRISLFTDTSAPPKPHDDSIGRASNHPKPSDDIISKPSDDTIGRTSSRPKPDDIVGIPGITETTATVTTSLFSMAKPSGFFGPPPALPRPTPPPSEPRRGRPLLFGGGGGGDSGGFFGMGRARRARVIGLTTAEFGFELTGGMSFGLLGGKTKGKTGGGNSGLFGLGGGKGKASQRGGGLLGLGGGKSRTPKKKGRGKKRR